MVRCIGRLGHSGSAKPRDALVVDELRGVDSVMW